MFLFFSSLQGWSVCLRTVLGCLNEKPQKRTLNPKDMLTHIAASPVQLKVQTKQESLNPGFGYQNSTLLQTPTAVNPRLCSVDMALDILTHRSVMAGPSGTTHLQI